MLFSAEPDGMERVGSDWPLAWRAKVTSTSSGNLVSNLALEPCLLYEGAQF